MVHVNLLKKAFRSCFLILRVAGKPSKTEASRSNFIMMLQSGVAPGIIVGQRFGATHVSSNNAAYSSSSRCWQNPCVDSR